MLWEIIFLFLIVLVGGFIQGVSGFGFGLVVMGFLPLFLTLKESTLIVIALLLVASCSILLKIYKWIDVKGLIVIVGSALVGRILSFFVLSTYGDMDILKQILGFFLIGMVIYLFFSKKSSSTEAKMSPVIPIVLGFLGGFIGGIFAVGGPFFVFYFLMLYKDKHTYHANLQVSVVITSLMTIILHGVNGDFHSTMLSYLIVGIIGVFIGTALGMKWFEKLPRTFIKKLAMSIVLVAALNLIFVS